MSTTKTPYHDAAQGLKGSLGGSFNATGITLADADSPAIDTNAGPVAEADRDERELYLQNLIQRANAGDEGAARLVASRAHAGSRLLDSDRKDQERFWREYIGGQLQELRDRLKAINLEIAQLDEKIDGFEKRLGEIKDQNDAIDNVVARYRAKGEIELDGDGKLADKKAEEALQAYEKRTGQKVDRNDFYAVFKALLAQQEENDREAARVREELRHAKDRRKELGVEAQKLETGAKAIENERDPAKQKEELDKLKPKEQQDVVGNALHDGNAESSAIARHILGDQAGTLSDDLAILDKPASPYQEAFREASVHKTEESEPVHTAQNTEINPANKPSGLA